MPEATWFLHLLECPDCGGSVADTDRELGCAGCGRRFPRRGGQLDCRLSAPRRTAVSVPATQRSVTWPRWQPPPDGAYRGPLPERTNPRHLSILAVRGEGLDVLDWGCGAAQYRPLVRDALGHRYVGIDIGGPGADVLADAHRLPFRSDAFDHAITNAVLAEMSNPFLAIAEVARVLKPGGVFSGSAAFLEPYCASWPTFFQPSPDGVVLLLEVAGFRVDGLWPQERWTIFDSLAAVPGPVTGPTRWLLRRLSTLERVLRRRHLHPRNLAGGGWLRRRSAEDIQRELLAITGQVDFRATKPA